MDALLSKNAANYGDGMSEILDVAEALECVPGIDPASFRIDVLGGGLTNRVYKLSGDGAVYVLRLDAPHTVALGLDRGVERQILQSACARRVAPKIMYSNVERGILLLHYIEGEVWTAADLADSGKLESLAELLRRVHTLPLSGKKFDAESIANTYIANSGTAADIVMTGERCKSIIRNIDHTDSICCCHNDVVAGNVISTPELMLLDWEYACDNNPLFDLASLIAYHELDDTSSMTLLSAYAGGTTAELCERLNLQIRLYEALYCLWLAARQAVTSDASQANNLKKMQRKLA